MLTNCFSQRYKSEEADKTSHLLRGNDRLCFRDGMECDGDNRNEFNRSNKFTLCAHLNAVRSHPCTRRETQIINLGHHAHMIRSTLQSAAVLQIPAPLGTDLFTLVVHPRESHWTLSVCRGLHLPFSFKCCFVSHSGNSTGKESYQDARKIAAENEGQLLIELMEGSSLRVRKRLPFSTCGWFMDFSAKEDRQSFPSVAAARFSAVVSGQYPHPHRRGGIQFAICHTSLYSFFFSIKALLFLN